MQSRTAWLKVRSGLVSLPAGADHQCCEYYCLAEILTVLEKAVLERDFCCIHQ